MTIHIACPGCKKRFSVSDKFAGQQGPCPNCKTVIDIPRKEDEVVIHAPEGSGPADSKGRPTLAPILREETQFSTKAAVVIGVVVVVVFVCSLWLRGMEEVPFLIRALGALALAPPLVLGGYTFLRNSELEPYRGQELWIRIGACSAAYAFLWGVYVWIAWVLEMPSFEIWQLSVIAGGAVLAGGFAAFASLDLDYVVGLVHYGLYLIVTILLSFVAKIEVF